MPERVSSCLWRATPAIVLLLDERFGEPVDSYVNGAQVWLRDDGPGGTALEWRLHPVAGFSWWGPQAFSAIRGESIEVTFDAPRAPMWREEGEGSHGSH